MADLYDFSQKVRMTDIYNFSQTVRNGLYKTPRKWGVASESVKCF